MFPADRPNVPMFGDVKSQLLSTEEGPAARVLNASGAHPVVLACEHASRFIPASLNGLGLTEAARTSHAAWDLGAFDLALELMAALDAPLVYSRISRLVYDCNRPPEASDAMPVTSEVFEIPGNIDLSDSDRLQRVQEAYEPFRQSLADLLESKGGASVLVTVHSFTPIYNGARRDVELGLLHDADSRLAKAMLDVAREGSSLRTGLNEPYAAADGVTHTLKLHAIPNGRLNVMIEVRNDLIDTPEGVRRVAADLISILSGALDHIAAQDTSK